MSTPTVWLEDAVFYTIRRTDQGETVFVFQNAEGKAVLSVMALDWAQGHPIINNNGEELVAALQRRAGA